MKFLMRLTTILLGVGAVALLTGVLLVGGVPEIYSSPLITLPAAALLIVQIVCLILGKSRKIGFYAVHVAVCVILISAFVSAFTFKEISFDIPVNGMWYDSVSKTEGGEVKFDFAISAGDLEIEYDEPDYTVYRYNNAIQAYELLSETVSCTNDLYRIGEGYSDIHRDMLQTDDGYVETYKTDDGLMLKRGELAVRMYRAELSVKTAEQTYSLDIAVNSPVFAEDWKFYFMDCDTENRNYITMYAKRDVTNIPMRIGLWLLLAGTLGLCLENLLRGRKAHGTA